MSWEERIPPLRAALIQPVDRNETYSASALTPARSPASCCRSSPSASRTASGSGWVQASVRSRCCTHTFATRHASTACCCSRAASFASAPTSRSRASPATSASRGSSATSCAARGRADPVALTCGTAEENRANNHSVAEALVAQGYPAWLAEVRDAHTWTCWRDAFDPHLPALIEAVVPDAAARGRDRRRRRPSPTATTAGRWSRSRRRTAQANDWEERGMVEALGDLIDGRPRQALLRPVVRQRELDAARPSARGARAGGTATTSGGSSRGSCRSCRPTRARTS